VPDAVVFLRKRVNILPNASNTAIMKRAPKIMAALDYG
jgi:hypothetical protein